MGLNLTDDDISQATKPFLVKVQYKYTVMHYRLGHDDTFEHVMKTFCGQVGVLQSCSHLCLDDEWITVNKTPRMVSISFSRETVSVSLLKVSSFVGRRARTSSLTRASPGSPGR